MQKQDQKDYNFQKALAEAAANSLFFGEFVT